MFILGGTKPFIFVTVRQTSKETEIRLVCLESPQSSLALKSLVFIMTGLVVQYLQATWYLECLSQNSVSPALSLLISL